MGNIKGINIKNCPYYFSDDMINIKNFDSKLIKIEKKSQKDIDNFYIEYFTKKDFYYVKINSVNHLYLIIDKVDIYIEESNKNKYLIFASTDKNKELLRQWTKLQNKIKNLIETINYNPI